MRVFILPDLGEGLQEAHIVEWHVEEGEDVRADQPLVSVETDKAVTEIPVPWTGRIAKLLSTPGETVKVGSALAHFDVGFRHEPDGSTGVTRPPNAPAPTAAAQPSPAQRSAVAMPAVRALARELGVDLASLAGTGPAGAIIVKDVANAFRAMVGAPGATRAEPAAPSLPRQGYKPLDPVRAAMARKMAASHAAVVPATVFEEARISSWHGRDDITARLVRAIAVAIAREPVFNAFFDADHGLKPNEQLDLGVAVDTPAGLVVPVLRNAGRYSAAEVRSAVDGLVEAAIERRLGPEAFKDPTFTLSNYGMIAGLHATPVVLPPQVAILGAGRLRRILVPVETDAVAETVLPLSLTYDHRPITGGEAARFIKALVGDLERAN
ncbi:MAG: dihydrolipoamide acetyltransferase family protein [Hyphomicrobiales bacterium]